LDFGFWWKIKIGRSRVLGDVAKPTLGHEKTFPLPGAAERSKKSRMTVVMKSLPKKQNRLILLHAASG
jgi:hypothetical protein